MSSFNFSNIKQEDFIIVGLGLSSNVLHIPGTTFVAKVPAPEGYNDIAIEKQVYERLQNHPNILAYHGQISIECLSVDNALIFDYHGHGDLRNIEGLQHPRQKLWPLQAASALSFIHSKGIVHGDIGLHNFLLTDDGDIVLCDFAGSGVDETLPTVSASGRYRNPLFTSFWPSQCDDIFALGTVLYELSLGKRMFQDKSKMEIVNCLKHKRFPDLSQISLPLRKVIEDCWQQPGYSAACAVRQLQGDSAAAEHRTYDLGWWSTVVAILLLAYSRHKVFENNVH